jgi:hemerythrin-like domain-containing protein
MGRQTLQANPNANRDPNKRRMQSHSIPLIPQETKQLQLSKEVIWVATEMCLAHNILILNLNAIYLQCEQVTQPKDVADFLIFCQASMEETRTHHEMEENSLFPWIAEYTGEKNIMEANLEQHHAFEAALKKLEAYLYSVTPEAYDGKWVKKLLEDFAVALVPHLNDEIPTLLALEKYGGEQLGVVYERFNKQILASVKDKVRVPCPRFLLVTCKLAKY